MDGKLQNISHYEKVAEIYDSKNSLSSDTISIKILVKRLERLKQATFNPADYKNALDVGCGTGNIASKLTRLGIPNIYGLDLSNNMLKVAQKNDTKITYVHGDSENLPFQDNFFDLIIYNSSLHHFPSYVKSLEESCRVLRDGGEIFLLCEKNKSGIEKMESELGIYPGDDGTDIHRFSPGDFEDFANSHKINKINIVMTDLVSFLYHKKLSKEIPENLRNLGYFWAYETDNILSSTDLSKYFVHIEVYLRK